MSEKRMVALQYAIQIASISGRNFQPHEVIELAQAIEIYGDYGSNRLAERAVEQLIDKGA